MDDLIKSYREKLENNPNDYTCLLFALQIPSICSRIEFPKTSENTGRCKDGKLYKEKDKPWDENMYKAWLTKHNDSFYDIYNTSMELNTFCDIVYKLRCKMTHEGVLMTVDSRFYFTDDDTVMSLGNIVFLPIKQLCEDMFDAASNVLYNRQEKFNITPFEDIFLSDDIYSKIQKDVRETYKSFWNKYSDGDKLLNYIYDHIIFDRPDMKLKIDEFFKNQPNDNFEIWDLGLKFGCIIDLEQRFIKQKYDENKLDFSRILKVDSDVLCLSKSEYERMLQVHQELDDFTNTHPFNIAQYKKVK